MAVRRLLSGCAQARGPPRCAAADAERRARQAAEAGRTEVVKALLEAGASPQAQDEVLAGPLCRA